MAHNDAISMAHSFLLNFQKIIFRHWNSRKIRIKRRSTINNRTTLFWRQISSKLFKKCLKFLTKTDTPESLKCNLFLFRYLLGLAFLWDMISIVFTLHNFSNFALTSSAFFFYASSRGTIFETRTVLLFNFKDLAKLKISKNTFYGDLSDDRSLVPTCRI